MKKQMLIVFIVCLFFGVFLRASGLWAAMPQKNFMWFGEKCPFFYDVKKGDTLYGLTLKCRGPQVHFMEVARMRGNEFLFASGERRWKVINGKSFVLIRPGDIVVGLSPRELPTGPRIR